MDNDYLTPEFINKQVVKREEGWGGMDNDYLTPVFINKQVVGREYCMGPPGGHLVDFCCCMKY